MASLASIEGLGGKAAKQIRDAARQGEFISKEDLMSKAKIGKSAVEKMTELGILADMPDTNQLTFDFI